MNNIAEAPNIACKISGLGVADWQWTVYSIRLLGCWDHLVKRHRDGTTRSGIASAACNSNFVGPAVLSCGQRYKRFGSSSRPCSTATACVTAGTRVV